MPRRVGYFGAGVVVADDEALLLLLGRAHMISSDVSDDGLCNTVFGGCIVCVDEVNADIPPPVCWSKPELISLVATDVVWNLITTLSKEVPDGMYCRCRRANSIMFHHYFFILD